MFSITLWHSGSGSGSVFAKRENSTKRPGSGTRKVTYDCTLKEPTSLHNPVFILKLDPAKSPHFNYAYVPAWGRYYFVTDITFVTQTICEISLKVDVLATYKNEIGASQQYVIRSYSDYDELAVDNLYPALATQTKMSRLFAGTTSLVTDMDEGFYVVGYIDCITDSSIPAAQRYGVIYVVLQPTEFYEMMKLIGRLALITDALKHIVSVVWYPFAPPYEAISGGVIDLGLVNYTPNVYRLIVEPIWSSSAFSASIPKHPEAGSRGKYLNLAPFSQYTLFNPLTGEYPIDALMIVDYSTLYFRIKCDCISGDAQINMFVSESGGAEYTIGTINCHIGVNIPVSTSSPDLKGQLIGTVQGAMAAAQEDYIGAASGAISSLESRLPQIRTQGVYGSRLPYNFPFKLRAEFTHTASEDRENRGRLLMKPKTINTLSGYILCADADISLPATAEEQSQVKSYLESGFFYE